MLSIKTLKGLIMEKLNRLKQIFISIKHRWDRYDAYLTISILCYGIAFSYLTLLKHYRFTSYAADLGVFNQAFYTTIFNGKLFYYTPELWLNPSGCFFAVHFSPILFLLLPIYAVYPKAESLLVAQSFIIASAAIPIYLLTIKHLGDKKAAVMMAIIYLLYVPIHGANWFDFHPQAFIPLTILSTYYFFHEKSWKPYFLMVILSLSIEEHLLYIIFFIATYCLVIELIRWHKRTKEKIPETRLNFDFKHRKSHFLKFLSNNEGIVASLLTMIICVAWFFIIRLVKSQYPITPEFLDVYRAVDVYRILGFNGDIAQLPIYIILNPQKTYSALYFDFNIKLLYFIILFTPLLFFSFRSSFTIVALAVLVPMLLTNYTPYYTIGAQYPLYLVPLIFIAAIKGLSTLNQSTAKTILKLSILVSLIFLVSTSPISPLAYSLSEKGILWYPNAVHLEPQKGYVGLLHKLLDTIPPNASILTINEIFPHVSSRPNAYLIPFDIPAFQEDGKKEIIENYTRELLNKSEYVLLNVKALSYWASFTLKELERGGQFKAYAMADSYILFKRNYNGSINLLPYGNYLEFVAYRDLLRGIGRIVVDKTSNLGYSVFAEKNVPANFVVFGPYICLPPANYTAIFEVKASNFEEGVPVAHFDVVDDFGSTHLAEKDLYGNRSEHEWFNVTLPFTIDKLRTNVEFRMFSTGKADLYISRVIIKVATQNN